MDYHRIVNLRLKVCGYLFDAAIDCDFALHAYDISFQECEFVVPIELYNMDKDWDIKMIYCRYKDINEGLSPTASINNKVDFFSHTLVSEEFIRKEIKKWIAENNKWYRFWYRFCNIFNKSKK